MAAEAGPSRPNQAISASTAHLKSLLEDDATRYEDVRTLVAQLLEGMHQSREAQREAFLSAAPALLSLDAEIESSLESLDTLSGFLAAFSNDLGAVSQQISTLQERSARLDEELRRKKAMEEPLGRLLDRGVVLNPRIVEKIFDGEVDHSWKAVVKELERSIEATRKPLDQLAAAPIAQSRRRSGLIPSLSRRESTASVGSSGLTASTLPATEVGASLNGDAAEGSYQSLVEARRIAEACKALAAFKIRAHLLQPLQVLRNSVTANLQVLQTSVLIPHHQPLYAFLARQSPRVAIDVQRAYVAAARLYFETGFRRYARSLGQVRKRGLKSGGGQGSIVDMPSSSSGGIAALLGAGSNSTNTSLTRSGQSKADPYLTDPGRIAHASLTDGEGAPPVTLGYMGDDASYTAPPEALFRSLSLVFFDNACSEFTFLVRYFESLNTVSSSRRHGGPEGRHRRPRAARSRSGSAAPTPTSGILSPSTSNPPTPISEEWDETVNSTIADGTLNDATSDYCEGADEDDGEDPIPPSESASAFGEAESHDRTEEGGNLVQLSSREQSLLKGRGASAELFRKIFDPVIGTWLNFARAILHGTSSTSTVSSAVAAGGSSASASGAASSTTGALFGLSQSVIGGAGGSGSGSALPLLPLLTTLRLTDQLISLADQRGAGAVLTGPLLQYKMDAWPLAQKRFGEEIDAVERLAGTGASKGGSSGSSAGWWGAFGGAAITGASSRGSSALKDLDTEAVLVIVARYAAIFAQITALTAIGSAAASATVSGLATSANTAAGVPAEQQLQRSASAGPEDPSSVMLSSSLQRLRSAVAALAQAKAQQSQTAASGNGGRLIADVVRRVRTTLEEGAVGNSTSGGGGGGSAAIVSSRTMKEVSWWREWERNWSQGSRQASS